MAPAHRVASPTLHILACFMCGCFAVVIALAVIIEIEIVARGQGKLEPVSRVHTIQSELDGSVIDIHAQVGDHLEAGELIATLDTTIASRDLAEIDANLVRLNWKYSRLRTLKQGIDNKSLDDVSAAFHSSVATEVASEGTDVEYLALHNELLAADVVEWRAVDQQIELQKAAQAQTVIAFDLEIKRLQDQYEFLHKRLENAKRLHSAGTISEHKFDEQSRDLNDTRDRLAIANAQRNKEIARGEEDGSALRRNRAAMYKSLGETIEQISAQRHEQERLRKVILRKLASAEIRTPIAGTIEAIDITSKGAVMSAGQQLATIVPSDGNVVMRVSFPNAEAGFLEVGQAALIGLEAFPSERFGMLSGQVIRIAQDASKNDDGDWGFGADINLKHSDLQIDGRSFPLKVGMTGRVDVVTGRRRVISYFFAPIMDVFQQSMGER